MTVETPLQGFLGLQDGGRGGLTVQKEHFPAESRVL